jgi:hypothetical protein
MAVSLIAPNSSHPTILQNEAGNIVVLEWNSRLSRAASNVLGQQVNAARCCYEGLSHPGGNAGSEAAV